MLSFAGSLKKIDALVARVFGASSESIDPAQLELLLQPPASTTTPETELVTTKPMVRTARARRERTTRLPENLPVIEQVLDPEPVQAQPDQWRCLGEEVNEQLDYEPAPLPAPADHPPQIRSSHRA